MHQQLLNGWFVYRHNTAENPLELNDVSLEVVPPEQTDAMTSDGREGRVASWLTDPVDSVARIVIK